MVLEKAVGNDVMMMMMMMVMMMMMMMMILRSSSRPLNNGDGDGDGAIVSIFTCAVLRPKCRKLLHSSSLQEGNLKERFFCISLFSSYFYVFIFLHFGLFHSSSQQDRNLKE